MLFKFVINLFGEEYEPIFIDKKKYNFVCLDTDAMILSLNVRLQVREHIAMSCKVRLPWTHGASFYDRKW